MKVNSVADHPSRRDILRRSAGSAVGLALSNRAFAVSDVLISGKGVAGQIQSAGVLTFGPNDVLFVGDSSGADVHVFALREKDLTPQSDVELGNFHNFEGRDLVQGVGQKMLSLRTSSVSSRIQWCQKSAIRARTRHVNPLQGECYA